MLDADSKPVDWALLLHELDDARGHLADLIQKMSDAGKIDEIDYGIRLGHVLAHLNRAWHWRDQMPLDPTPEKWRAASEFPRDLDPIG